MLSSKILGFYTRLSLGIQIGSRVQVLGRETRVHGPRIVHEERERGIGDADHPWEGHRGAGAGGCHGVDGVEDRGEDVRVSEVRVDKLVVRRRRWSSWVAAFLRHPAVLAFDGESA